MGLVVRKRGVGDCDYDSFIDEVFLFSISAILGFFGSPFVFVFALK